MLAHVVHMYVGESCVCKLYNYTIQVGLAPTVGRSGLYCVCELFNSNHCYLMPYYNKLYQIYLLSYFLYRKLPLANHTLVVLYISQTQTSSDPPTGVPFLLVALTGQ